MEGIHLPGEIYFVLKSNTLFAPTDVAQEREVEGDLILGDVGEGLPFRPGSFDGVIRYCASFINKSVYNNNIYFFSGFDN